MRPGCQAYQSGIALTTDSFVISPIFFPGGDIGSLAVLGSVNDLAVSGARPLYLSLSLIIEEGFPLAVLKHVLGSAAKAASEVGVSIVAGDTKVVPCGAADGLFINTTGIGRYESILPTGPSAISEGDELVVTGPIGRHGIAVLCAREELKFEPAPVSDCGSLVEPAKILREQLGENLRAMRDATRGGVAAVMHEWADGCNLTLSIQEANLPVSSDVRGACELLGLDPLHVANEGTMVIAVAAGFGEVAVQALRSLSCFEKAAVIGEVVPRKSVPVTVERSLGTSQPLDDPLGAPLPRIC